jgi:hypothetical protein
MAAPRRDSSSAPSGGSSYSTPPARELKRERKTLLLVREERLRDLGGLALEMYKRDRFSAGLIVERCAELVAIEARVQEIDALLDGSARLQREGVGTICVCGAPLLFGARFCATCGRPAGAGTATRPGFEAAR